MRELGFEMVRSLTRSSAKFAGLGLALAVVGLGASGAAAQVSITTLGTPVTQNFDGLLRTGGTHSEVPTGWLLLETGANADQKYSASTGGGSTAESYSFGANNATERAFGSIASGSLEATIGARFTNNGGAPITSLALAYAGEWWRAGDSASDRLVFEYSLNASNLSNGTWVALTALDFSHLDVPCQGANTCGAGNAAKDGNVAAFRAQKSATISGLSIAIGASFMIRWRDTNGIGADQGLAIDDFSLTANAVAAADPIVEILKDVALVAGAQVLPGSVLEYSLLIGVDAGSPQGVASFVLSDTLPDTVSAIVSAVDPSYEFSLEVDQVTNLTAAADGDAGEIVNGVVTVRVGALPVDGLALVTFRVIVAETASKFTLANVGSATFDGAVSGSGFEVESNEALISVVACASAGDCGDDNDCTTDACTAGNCGATPRAGACDDGSAATHSDVCGGGDCGGTPVVCTTPNQCQTAGTPNGTATCAPVPKANTETCDDGNAATVGDRCDGAGGCVGTTSECPADPICQRYSFNGTACVLVAADDGGDCDDGDPCTRSDVCAAGACLGAPLCDSGEACDAGGRCSATHCLDCDETSDCGRDGECLAIGADSLCLIACDNDNDCTDGQACGEHATGGKRCFDASGPCALPVVDPDGDPEVGPEVGPESDPEVGPEVVESTEDVADEAETLPEPPVETGPESTVETSPESPLEPVPESTPEASPEAGPEANPEQTADVSNPEASVESTGDAGVVKSSSDDGCTGGGSASLVGLALLALVAFRRRSALAR